jgi:acetate kinase
MQTMLLLTVNTGSSSLKLALYEKENLVRKAILSVERIGSIDARLIVHGSSGAKEHKIRAKNHVDALAEVIHDLPELFSSALHAIGHRIVHGGADHSKPEAITTHLLDELREVKHLDATHMPQALAVIDSLMRQFPNVPQFVCFDTAFHRSMPEFAQRYPLPRWTSDAGVRRYGFHGLSYEYIASTLPDVAPAIATRRVIVAHLGSGASMCAIDQGRSIESTMGFTALDGLPMGTRPGQLDPGVLLYLISEKGMSAAETQSFLYRECGLKGLSGMSNDMRELQDSVDPHAVFAVDYFVYRVGLNAGMWLQRCKA